MTRYEKIREVAKLLILIGDDIAAHLDTIDEHEINMYALDLIKQAVERAEYKNAKPE